MRRFTIHSPCLEFLFLSLCSLASQAAVTVGDTDEMCHQTEKPVFFSFARVVGEHNLPKSLNNSLPVLVRHRPLDNAREPDRIGRLCFQFFRFPANPDRVPVIQGR